MDLFFPDLNVWMALSVARHPHNASAWNWLSGIAAEEQLILSRYTQLGILRLLTNAAVMGDQTLTLRQAWTVYDRWLQDTRVEFHPDSRNIDIVFRRATEPFASKEASKWVGDCWLLAFAETAGARLVTFDKALHAQARKMGNRAVIPA